MESTIIKVYRITYKGIGIYEAIRKILSETEWIEFLSNPDTKWLPKPPDYRGNYISYFTEDGFNLFKKKTLPLIAKYIDSKFIENTTTKIDISDAVYSDQYQIIINSSSQLSKLFSDLKTPEELLKWMSHNLKYGFVSKKNGKVIDYGEDVSENIFFEEYFLQSPEQLLDSKIGVCWDHAEFERAWFKHHQIPHNVFYYELLLAPNYPTHTTLIYTSKIRNRGRDQSVGRDEFNWFENSWYEKRGIHPFNSLSDAIVQISESHKKSHTSDEKVIIRELKTAPKYGISCDEYMKWANGGTAVQLITEAGGPYALTISNSKRTAHRGKWKDPGAKLYDILIDATDYGGTIPTSGVELDQRIKDGVYKSSYDFLKEAYLEVGEGIKNSPYGRTPFSQSGCKGAHHIVKDEKLVVSVEGLKKAYDKAFRNRPIPPNVKAHLNRHLKELGITVEHHHGQMYFKEAHDLVIDKNFTSIELFINESTANPELDYYRSYRKGIIFEKVDNIERKDYEFKRLPPLYKKLIQMTNEMICNEMEELIKNNPKYKRLNNEATIKELRDTFSDPDSKWMGHVFLQKHPKSYKGWITINYAKQHWDFFDLPQNYIDPKADPAKGVTIYTIYREMMQSIEKKLKPLFKEHKGHGLNFILRGDPIDQIHEFEFDLDPHNAEDLWEHIVNGKPATLGIREDGDGLDNLFKEATNIFTSGDFSHYKCSPKQLEKAKGPIVIPSNLFQKGESKISGTGIFAISDIEADVNIGLAFTRRSNSGIPDKDYQRTDLGKFTNHSKNPNVKPLSKDNLIYFISINKIRTGDEITVNYQEFQWEGKRDFGEEGDVLEGLTERVDRMSQRGYNNTDDDLSWIESHLIQPVEEAVEDDEKKGKWVSDKPKEPPKNGANRKRLYVMFMEWAKSQNPKNSFGNLFDKPDAFGGDNSFIPHDLRYFYMLANPILCILTGNLTFFSMSELKDLNKDNKQIDTLIIFAASDNETEGTKMRVYNSKDRKVYQYSIQNEEMSLEKTLASSFDLYLQQLIGKGNILSGSE